CSCKVLRGRTVDLLPAMYSRCRLSTALPKARLEDAPHHSSHPQIQNRAQSPPREKESPNSAQNSMSAPRPLQNLTTHTTPATYPNHFHVTRVTSHLISLK